MQEILFASTNKGKIAELQEIASPYKIRILNPQDLAASFGPVPEVIEGVVSYHENAHLKAKAFYEWSKLPSLADDAGLEVDALGGAPGVKSARFAGEQATMEENKALLLFRMHGIQDRRARFRSVLCYVDGVHEPVWSEATLDGSITEVESGKGGFGYDPILQVTGYTKTLAEIKESERIETHRAKAFAILLDRLSKH